MYFQHSRLALWCAALLVLPSAALAQSPILLAKSANGESLYYSVLDVSGAIKTVRTSLSWVLTIALVFVEAMGFSYVLAGHTLPGASENMQQMGAYGIAFLISVILVAFTHFAGHELCKSGKIKHARQEWIETGRHGKISTGKPRLAKFDQCMSRQSAQATQAVGGALHTSFDGTSGDIAKSDVFASLKDISGKVRQSKANEKVVLLASDMLENSSVSSFYASQSVRRIDPERELKLATDSQLIGNFGDARVYVIGAGLLSDDGKKNKAAYRDPKTMQALASFWKSYFDKSKAQLVEFGQPALLNQIK